MTEILGNGKQKRKYNPDLGRIANEAFEKEKILLGKKRIEKRIEREKMSDTQRRINELDLSELIRRPVIDLDYQMNQLRHDDFMIIYRAFLDLPSSKRKDINPGAISALNPITANEIFYFASRKNEIHQKGSLWTGALFLSQLITASQEKEFYVDFTEMNKDSVGYNFLPNIGFRLKDKKLYVKGNVGDGLGFGAENCTFVVVGDVGREMGTVAKNCRFMVDGDIKSVYKKLGNDSVVFIEELSGGLRQIHPNTEVYDG